MEHDDREFRIKPTALGDGQGGYECLECGSDCAGSCTAPNRHED